LKRAEEKYQVTVFNAKIGEQTLEGNLSRQRNEPRANRTGLIVKKTKLKKVQRQSDQQRGKSAGSNQGRGIRFFGKKSKAKSQTTRSSKGKKMGGLVYKESGCGQEISTEQE